MAFNRVILMGRITHELELKTTPSGVSVCSFQIAVDRRFQAKGEEKKSDFFNIVTWRQTAEFVKRYFGKGRMILVEGELQTRTYVDKNGQNVRVVEIVAEQVCFTGEKANGGGGTYSDVPYGDPPPERGGYSNYSAPSAPSAPAVTSGISDSASAASSAPADFSSADDDDYPF